jgi:hypothetical protein
MRSLGTIRARVERLASDCLSSPETVFVCWQDRYKQCPACAFDLDAHARETALAAAVARPWPGDDPPGMLFYSTDVLTSCPHCHAPLPSV